MGGSLHESSSLEEKKSRIIIQERRKNEYEQLKIQAVNGQINRGDITDHPFRTFFIYQDLSVVFIVIHASCGKKHGL